MRDGKHICYFAVLRKLGSIENAHPYNFNIARRGPVFAKEVEMIPLKRHAVLSDAGTTSGTPDPPTEATNIDIRMQQLAQRLGELIAVELAHQVLTQKTRQFPLQ